MPPNLLHESFRHQAANQLTPPSQVLLSLCPLWLQPLGLSWEEWLWGLLQTPGALLPWLTIHSPWQAQLVEDFRALRQTAKDMKLFEAEPTFFALLLGHILAMEVLAWLIIYLLGPGWVPSTLAALILAISQVTLAVPYTVQHTQGPAHADIMDMFAERMNKQTNEQPASQRPQKACIGGSCHAVF